jgi:hypothetical protein
MRTMSKIGVVSAMALVLATACADDGLDGQDELGADESGAVDEPGAEARAGGCEIHIGTTFRSGNTIIGYGSQANCGSQGTSYLTIQRSRWFGWEDLTTQSVTGSGHDVYVSYNCSGTGTHTFRTIHTGRTIGGNPVFKGSNQITVTCN